MRVHEKGARPKYSWQMLGRSANGSKVARRGWREVKMLSDGMHAQAPVPIRKTRRRSTPGRCRVLYSCSQPPALLCRGIYSTATAHSKFKIKVRRRAAPTFSDCVLTRSPQAAPLEILKCEFPVNLLFIWVQRDGGLGGRLDEVMHTRGRRNGSGDVETAQWKEVALWLRDGKAAVELLLNVCLTVHQWPNASPSASAPPTTPRPAAVGW